MSKTVDRKKLIQLIHVARRDMVELQDEDTYRAMLRAVTGLDSCSAMRDDQLQDVLNHLKKSGFTVRSKAKPSRPLAQGAECKKIRALWLFLHQLEVVKNPSEEALAAYVKRLTGVDALQWINGEQSLRLIEALKKWAMRFLPGIVEKLIEQVRPLPLSDMDREALNYALAKAFKHKTFDPMHTAWEYLTDALKKYAREAQ